MKRIVILTSGELRHSFFRKYLALQPEIEVVQSYCETTEKNLVARIENTSENQLRYAHLEARSQSEKDFFELFVSHTDDTSNPVSIPKGSINDADRVAEIIKLNPDVIISYGCSIIKPALIAAFSGKFINIHLGLSPYYRGSGTNFWPFVNGAPEYCGVTFMYIDAGIDTGAILHQIRPEMFPSDTFHGICNRLLVQMTEVAGGLLSHFDDLEPLPQPSHSVSDKVYTNAMFTEESVDKMHTLFRESGIEKYIEERAMRHEKAPILQNPVLV